MPTHIGHLEIDQSNVHGLGLDEFNPSCTIPSVMHLKTLASELARQGATNVEFIVHDENCRFSLFQASPRRFPARRELPSGLIILLRMNDELFKRFLSGDPHATTGVRNHLRAIAHRLLDAPQWEMKESDTRRERETAAVAEVLRNPGGSMVQAASRVMTVSARIGIEHLRSTSGIPSTHIAADTLARKAMDRLEAEEEEPLRQYLDSCSTCTAHLEQARNAIKAAISAQKQTPRLPSTTPTPMSGQFRSASPKRVKTTSTKKHPKLSKAAGLSSSELITRGLMLFALVFGIQQLTKPSKGELASAEEIRRANLLPKELPPVALASTLPANVGAAVQLMEAGRCKDSASRIARFVERNPDDRLLRYYHSLALICDRQKDEAIQSFSQLRQMEGEKFWGENWWYAQALYLGGGEEKALTLLGEIADSNHGRAADAEALLNRLIENQ